MLSGDCTHLSLRDHAMLRRSIDIFLIKMRDMQRSDAADVLAVLAGLKTAQEMLKLRCDAATVAAVLLGQAAVTAGSPTWPLAAPDTFTLEVDGLLAEQRRLKTLRGMVPDLDDANAYRARTALLSTMSDPRSRSDPRALLVLLACELTQLRASASLPKTTQQRLAVEAVQLYAPLSHAIGFGEAFRELETLSYSKLFPESLRRLRRWYRQVWPDAHELVPRLSLQIRSQLLDEAPALDGLLGDVTVSGRVKEAASTFRKLLRDSINDIELVRDILALRIVFTPAHEAVELMQGPASTPLSATEVEALLCHGIYRQLQRKWMEVPGRLKDFVSSPKQNGYQSIHTNLRLPDGRTFEVQIRSTVMHAKAEYGAAAHHRYRATQLGGVSDGAQVVQAALKSVRTTPALPLAGTTTNSSSMLSSFGAVIHPS